MIAIPFGDQYNPLETAFRIGAKIGSHNEIRNRYGNDTHAASSGSRIRASRASLMPDRRAARDSPVRLKAVVAERAVEFSPQGGLAREPACDASDAERGADNGTGVDQSVVKSFGDHFDVRPY